MFVTSDYLDAIANTSRFVFDKNNGKSYSLRALFIKQRLGDGLDAFSRNADLLEKTIFDFDEALEKELQKVRRMIPADVFKQLDEQTDNKTDRQKRLELQRKERVCRVAEEYDTNEKDFLFNEDSVVLSGKLIFQNPSSSRVILIANAGFGKTTILQRIKLALSDRTPETLEEDASFLASIEENPLKKLIPCYISLSDEISDLTNTQKLIIASISKVINIKDDDIASWLESIDGSQLVLLIDGLEELPADSAKDFLDGLGVFLHDHSTTRIVMTTRVSGIDTEEIQNVLRRLRFHGRAILPLNDSEAKLFCEKYILQTGNDPRVLKNFERIQSETYLGYLRVFTRNPMELIMLLKYLPAQSGLMFNRWDLFYAVLRSKITSHIELVNKESVFRDELSFLSLVAYRMQKQNKSFLTIEETAALIPFVERLSLYTNLFNTSSDNSLVTIDLVWRHIKQIAQDIDVVEIKESRILSMPTRAYREFLAAYATCNLCLEEDEDYPDPLIVLSPHFCDPKWLGVIEFAIAEMESSGLEEENDNFISNLYKSRISMASLFKVIDNDYDNSIDVAKALCEAKLRKLVLGKEDKQLVYRVMKTKSASNYKKALASLYKESFQVESSHLHTLIYLEAAAYAFLFDAMEKHHDPLLTAVELLKSKRTYENAIGAEILVLLARVQLQEEPFELESFDSCQWEIPKETCSILTELAIETHSFIFVSALTELYVSMLIEETIIHPYLTRQLLDIAIDELNRCLSVFSFTSIPLLRHSKSETVSHLKDVINSIGLFPFELSDSLDVNDLDETPPVFVKSFFEEPNQDAGIDSIALTISDYHLTGSKEMLQKHWMKEDARVLAMPLFGGEEDLSKRCENHYHLIKDSFEKLNVFNELIEKGRAQKGKLSTADIDYAIVGVDSLMDELDRLYDVLDSSGIEIVDDLSDDLLNLLNLDVFN